MVFSSSFAASLSLCHLACSVHLFFLGTLDHLLVVAPCRDFSTLYFHHVYEQVHSLSWRVSAYLSEPAVSSCPCLHCLFRASPPCKADLSHSSSLCRVPRHHQLFESFFFLSVSLRKEILRISWARKPSLENEISGLIERTRKKDEGGRKEVERTSRSSPVSVASFV